MNDNILNYEGPADAYRPVIDNYRNHVMPKPPKMPGEGYADLDTLNELLDHVADTCSKIYSRCSSILAKYTVKLDTTNTELMQAHDLVYPSDNTPGYITFDEYKYLLTREGSHAISYLRNFYEESLRGVNGHVALDFSIICRVTHAEVSRIRHFIETYIGELDETAEFRTVELFQDWATEASNLLQRITKAIEAPIQKGLPRDEVARLTPELSANHQAFFQLKINRLNRYITDFMEMLEKAWNGPSDNFYNSVLGPGLVFQHTVAKSLTSSDYNEKVKWPTLAAEVEAGMIGMAQEFNGNLHDQLVRNQSYYNYVEGVLLNYEQRDTYKNIIKQLAGKGKALVNNFIEASTLEQAEEILKAPNPLSVDKRNLAYSTHLLPSHQDLEDREDPDAHPQYFLKEGGTITGDIKLADGVRIDGIIPSTHRHDGKDGSVKIHGSHIEYGTITDDNINPDATTSTPTNLSVSSIAESFATRVTVEVEFDVDTTNIVNYEFEFAKLS